MTWDASVPAGTDLISQGDDAIREMKTDLASALNHEFSTFPGATPASPIFVPGFMRGVTADRPTGDSLVEGRLYINTTLNCIERYNGATWDVVAENQPFPSGTVLLFYQAAAPTGWTKIVTQNDKMLRVVSGTGGGSGGTIAASTTLAHSHTVASHTHTIAHKHVSPVCGQNVTLVANGRTDGAGWPYGSTTIAAAQCGEVLASGTNSRTSFLNTGDTLTANSGAATPATDSQLAGAMAYIDVIACSKD